MKFSYFTVKGIILLYTLDSNNSKWENQEPITEEGKRKPLERSLPYIRETTCKKSIAFLCQIFRDGGNQERRKM